MAKKASWGKVDVRGPPWVKVEERVRTNDLN